jgi:peptide deformylase
VGALARGAAPPARRRIANGAAIDRSRASPYVSAMAKLPILTLPDPLLRKPSKPVERVGATLLKLADDMLETMYAAPGVGLAAVQVGRLLRVIVLDTTEEGEQARSLVLINPRILSLGKEMRLREEGCLSIPDVRVDIERPSALRVGYIDREGERQELVAEGLLATAIQHEIDHLNGKLIIDYLSRLKRDIIVRRFKKQAKIDHSA